MLARIAWPLQAACRRHPLGVSTACVVFTGFLAAAAWPEGLSRELATAIAAACILGTLAARSVLVAVATGGTATASAAACDLGGAPEAAPFVIAATAAAMLPLGRAIADARSAAALAVAIPRGTGFLAFATQLAIAALIPEGWPACLGVAVALALGAFWIPAATAWRRLETPAHADQPRPLPPERGAPALEVFIARAILLALAVVAWHRDWNIAWPTWLVLALISVVWTTILGRALVSAAIVAYGVVVADVAGASLGDAASAPQALAALGAAQALPLLAWWSRATGRPPALTLVAWVALAIAVASAPTGHALPAVLAGGAGWIVLLAAERQAIPTGEPRRLIRRAAGALPPYWRHYLRGKLLFDPVYRQLAEDEAPWGRVLDAGCGPGLIAALAATRSDATAYCGIDLDEDKLVTARRLLARCGRPLNDKWQLLAGRLPFPQPLPRRFDTVLLLDVLHYWSPAQQAELLAQLRAAIETGGRLWLREGIAATDGGAGRVALAERFTTLFGLNPGTGQLSFPTREALEAMLTAAGFRVRECHESGAENRLFLCDAI